MRKRFLILLVIGVASLLLNRCVSTQSESGMPSDRNVVTAQGSIHDDFNKVCKLMLDGDTQTVYDKYLSNAAHRVQSYEEFAQGYKINKDFWNTLFKGAILKQVSPEEKVASAIVVWGTGESSVIEFSKEDNKWKINYLRGPVAIFEGGTKME